jgi:hypothetical protein
MRLHGKFWIASNPGDMRSVIASAEHLVKLIPLVPPRCLHQLSPSRHRWPCGLQPKHVALAHTNGQQIQACPSIPDVSIREECHITSDGRLMYFHRLDDEWEGACSSQAFTVPLHQDLKTAWQDRAHRPSQPGSARNESAFFRIGRRISKTYS